MESGNKLQISEQELTVANELGLHARPAALLAQVASRFSSDITLSSEMNCVNCKSAIALLRLCAGCGTKVLVHAEGPDAENAVSEIANLFEAKFNEG